MAPFRSFDPVDLDPATCDRIIERAGEDRTPLEAIESQFGPRGGCREKEAIRLMRHPIESSGFWMGRKRVSARTTLEQCYGKAA